ncbi:MAG: adenylate/guanylate cyclase domain-containing protein [Saprospiraceae bacterium]|nr:adenylate/guanylate cyclase domain-containing protein [Saprospiraceae bacterium]
MSKLQSDEDFQICLLCKNTYQHQYLFCIFDFHTGLCMVGNFGSAERMDYTIIGEAVNMASRLESNSHPGKIQISQNTYDLVKDKM